MEEDRFAPLPRDEMHAALGETHPERETVDALHAELGAERPDRGAITSHVSRLRSIPEIAAIIANWWDDPRTQQFLVELTGTGL
jgi:hypothetical protein